MSARRESPPIIITPKPEEKTKEEPEQPATFQQSLTPRKNSAAKAIAVIAIFILVIAVISFFSSGDKAAIDTAKEIFKGEEEIPVFTDDFNRQEFGENWDLGTGKWQIENDELVGENTGLDAWIHLMRDFEADEIVVIFDAWIESKEWKPETEIGCYFYGEGNENDYYPILLFDGQANIFDKTENPLWRPFATGTLRSNKIYRIKATRNQQQEKVCLSFVVSNENGKIIANNNKKVNSGRERVKIGFFSSNVINHSHGSDDKIHIDNLKIYAYTT